MAKYCDSLTKFQRRKTVEVKVGSVRIGGDNPVRIQSMANTDTNDVEKSVAQACRVADAGGELMRFTTQGLREAENLVKIHAKLREAGYDVPLVADVHFNSEVAMAVASEVEKVRINPGNFVASRSSDNDEEAMLEYRNLREKFIRLLDICRAHGTALRIGVNHGSLSRRIMSLYGDTPDGMVESAMEFLRIAKEKEFKDIVVSMKSSNVRVMVHAYRLLAVAMSKENMCYPLHLGVTEAGNGEDGRVKSAAGMGALLADGIGDTLRVSLTEPPENEIPVAKLLVRHFEGVQFHEPIPDVREALFSPYEYKKRESVQSGIIGGNNVPVVVASAVKGREELQADFYVDGDKPEWLELDISNLKDTDIIAGLRSDSSRVIILQTSNRNGMAEQRAFFLKLMELGIHNPVIIKRSYCETELGELQIKASADFGPLFLDGFGDGIWIDNKNPKISDEDIVSLSFAILQAARVRTSRTEYIACPGCGRTKFDLQGTLAAVKSRTSHLKGLKIAVMGCIVNGPGEMADADYGYVGAGRGKVTLYKGKTVMKRDVDEKDAIDELLRLIEETENSN